MGLDGLEVLEATDGGALGDVLLFGLPDLDGGVLGGSEEDGAAVAPAEALDGALVGLLAGGLTRSGGAQRNVLDDLEELASGGVPHHQTIRAGGEQEGQGGVEQEGVDGSGVLDERQEGHEHLLVGIVLVEEDGVGAGGIGEPIA